MPRLAAFINPSGSLEHARARAGIAETAGYELVLDNHVAGRDGLATLLAYERTTRRVRLGTGVYPAFTMSPLALGQLAATIDEQLDGRLVLGIGTSHEEVVEGWHARSFPERPLTAMRDTVTILRSLFTEGSVDHDGDERSAGGFTFSRLEPRPDLPIMIGALGPGMCRLGGELADGVMTWLCTPAYIREVVAPQVAAGARRAGRDPAEVEIIPAVPACVTDEPEPARERLCDQLAMYLSLPFYRSMLADSGFGDALERFDEAAADGDGDALRAAAAPVVDAVAGIGPAGAVRDRLDEYRAAGATLPGVGPQPAEGSAGVQEILLAAAGRGGG